MRKTILDLTVVENIRLNYHYILLKLGHDEVLPEIKPAQFAQVRVDGSPETFLRRPISINFVDKEKNQLWLLIQVVGAGTQKLSELEAGDKLNLIFPLGNSFTPPADKSAKIALVGGGVGVAPLLMYGRWLHENGYKCNFLIGARSKVDLLQLELFEQYGTVYTTTEDGSAGEKGYITQHSKFAAGSFDHIFTCGPTPMMKAVSGFALANDIFCEVSLENLMGCGIGTCLCCITATTEGNLCVCTDGPVFNVRKLKWQI